MNDSVRRRGRPARLSRDAILLVAEEIVDSGGIDALTMRAVAQRLSSSPMAIYRHVRDKDELLLLLLDRVAATLKRPELPDDPRQRLVVLWRFLHDELAAHPWVVGVLASGNLVGRSILWLLEELLQAFVACGLTAEQAGAAYRAVWQYTVGVLTIRIAMTRTGSDPDRVSFQTAMIDAADPGETPAVAALATAWPHAWDNYDFGLNALLDGLIPRS
ncbi:TetR/AcrR family transcriptional regulator [Nocardia sp. CS682]|uniref:TetR/AcrR family transcriptional regulator n=1 Tax=Nocardia sp. CS682 TaxID=1047172 RepID=UPI0010755FC4|nr:TetR/AcrR family transcriptional regulator C-terminal domain-containing protein [Nocardia sp. CS682]QBS39752.1 TetR/AcrR family transcriptional regulator [Nocardia sp. CS682]